MRGAKAHQRLEIRYESFKKCDARVLGGSDSIYVSVNELPQHHGYLVSLGLWDHFFAGAVPGAADRSGIGRNRPSESESVAALSPHRARNGCLGQRSPQFAMPGPYFGEVHMQEELTYVGIDIAKERLYVAIRPSGRSWSLPYDKA